MLSGVLQAGVSGIQDGIRRSEQAAAKIASAGLPPESTGETVGTREIAEPMVELKLYEKTVQASAAVVKTADEVLGTLIDIKA